VNGLWMILDTPAQHFADLSVSVVNPWESTSSHA
jgi:hypothetical protein